MNEFGVRWQKPHASPKLAVIVSGRSGVASASLNTNPLGEWNLPLFRTLSAAQEYNRIEEGDGSSQRADARRQTVGL